MKRSYEGYKLTEEEDYEKHILMRSERIKRIRHRKIVQHNVVCQRCGKDFTIWRGNKNFPREWNLILHHVDGNWRNNDWDNLMLVCRGCHSKMVIHKYKVDDNGNILEARYIQKELISYF